MKRVLMPLVALVALLALNRFPPTVLNPYYFQVLILVGINITLAVSLNLVNGFTGQFSIGHAGFMAAGAYGSAMFTVTWGRSSPPRWSRRTCPRWSRRALLLVSLLLGGGLAAIFGYLVGLPSLRLRGDYLAIVTLGFGEIIRVLILNIDAVGGARGLPGIPQWANFFWVFLVATIVIVLGEPRQQHARPRAVRDPR